MWLAVSLLGVVGALLALLWPMGDGGGGRGCPVLPEGATDWLASPHSGGGDGAWPLRHLQAPAPPASPPEHPAARRRMVSREELAAGHGGPGSSGLLLAIGHVVLNVSGAVGREFYGPGNKYSCFAARDASYALVVASLEPQDMHDDLSLLTPAQDAEYVTRFEFYTTKYPVVGVLEGPDVRLNDRQRGAQAEGKFPSVLAFLPPPGDDPAA
jgi:membrane-associated progesterone receptor component